MKSHIHIGCGFFALNSLKIEFSYQLFVFSYQMNTMVSTNFSHASSINLLNLPEDVLCVISAIVPYKVARVARKLYTYVQEDVLRASKASLLAKWYRKNRLTDAPETDVDLEPGRLHRFYLLRYEKEWLLRLPKDLIHKCTAFGYILPVLEPGDEKFNEVLADKPDIKREILYFLRRYTTPANLICYGW